MRLAPLAAVGFLLASESASAASLYFRSGVGLGFGLYTYPTTVQAGRRAEGVLANFSVDLGGNFGGLLVGGTASFDPILGIYGVSPGGTQRTALLTPGGGFGPFIGAHIKRLTLILAVLIGGGGAFQIAGGFGAYVAPFVGFTLLHSKRLHIMAHGRPLIGYLQDFQAGGPVLFIGGTGGVSIAWM